MRPFTVVWWEFAQSKLADLWLESKDRAAVARAANEIDRRLAADPTACVEEDHEGLCRTSVDPLSVQFTIDEDNRAAIIWMVRSTFPK
jgi:hypothetical protein